jgi:hypothetical protein
MRSVLNKTQTKGGIVLPIVFESKEQSVCKKPTFFDDLLPGFFRKDQFSSFGRDDQLMAVKIVFPGVVDNQVDELFTEDNQVDELFTCKSL